MLKVTFLLNILALTLLTASARIYDDSFDDGADFFYDNFNWTESDRRRLSADTESGRKLFSEYDYETQPMSCIDVGACQGGFATGTCPFDRGLYVDVWSSDPVLV